MGIWGRLRLLILGLVFLAGLASAQVSVRGYFRRDGTYVRPHYRSNPDGNFGNNWSTYGNVNPYTGELGTKRTPPRNYAWDSPELEEPRFTLPSSDDVWVNGYTRRDGTYVRSHFRSAPDGDPANNWSTYPNVNPYTGRVGTKRSSDGEQTIYAPPAQSPASTWSSNAVLDGYERGQRAREEALRAELEQVSTMLELATALSAARQAEVAPVAPPPARVVEPSVTVQPKRTAPRPIVVGPVPAQTVPVQTPRKQPTGTFPVGMQVGNGRPEVVSVTVENLGAGKYLFAWQERGVWVTIVRADTCTPGEAIRAKRAGQTTAGVP